ncbi:MAG: FxLYD domain-containing protein, partial [Anaerolineae bacterium]
MSGRVRNDGSSTVEYVAPVGTLYDAEGNVVGCKFTYADDLILAPGETSAF